MLKDPRVSALVFYVANPERSAAFYHDVLGLPTSSIDTGEGQLHTADAGETLLLFFKGDDKPGRTPIVVFGLDGGIESLVEELVRKGVEIVLPVSDAPGGGLTADFLDPDGHLLSFYQSAGLPRRRD